MQAALATAGGIGLPLVVTQQDIDAYTLDGSLDLFIECNTKHYQAGGGKYTVVATIATTEIDLAATTCSQLKLIG